MFAGFVVAGHTDHLVTGEREQRAASRRGARQIRLTSVSAARQLKLKKRMSVLSGDIASCIPLTAAKSSAPAGRISTVVPSARSAYTWRFSCAMLIGVSPIRRKRSWSEGLTRDDEILVGVAEPVTDRHHTPDVR
jgi:hypothetical protein